MLTPTSNTIDFDSARQERLSSDISAARETQPETLNALHTHLLAVLPSSLDIERVLQLFQQEVDPLVKLPGLSYRHPALPCPTGVGQGGGHSVTYHLSQAGLPLGELSFHRMERFHETELLALEYLIGTLLHPLRNALLYREAVAHALRDPLTGVGNRAALDQSLLREVDLARRTAQPLSLLMLDLDHFKRINDDFGHTFGDEVLRLTATTIANCLRGMDMIFRFGGEEFCALLSATSHAGACGVAERIRHAVERLQLLHGERRIPVTLSVGIATLRGLESPTQLLHRADEALYQAKRTGRNRLHALP